MKKSYLKYFISLIVLISVAVPESTTWAGRLDGAIFGAYRDRDYATTVRLLRQRVAELEEQSLSDERHHSSEFIRKSMMLAYLYAWKLNNPDEALQVYTGLLNKKAGDKSPKFIQLPLLVLIGNVYEQKKDYVRAKEFHFRMLEGSAAQIAEESDLEVCMMIQELTNFVRYRIDSINLKTDRAGHEPLFAEIKLPSLASPLNVWVYSMLVNALVPPVEMDITFSAAGEGDLAAHIIQSPENFPAILLNYMLVSGVAAGEVDASSEKAMEAYIAKYPESYLALLLRCSFYQFYKESGQERKAEKLLAELENIAQKRGIQLIVDPDERFSSPEKTWETLRNALLQGDLLLVKECHVPGHVRYKALFVTLGKDRLKEIGKDMPPLRKITSGDGTTEYTITREEAGKRLSSPVRFENIGGEWKLVVY